MEENKLILRPFEDADIQLFENWVQQEYVLKWYEHPENWLTELRARNDEYNWIHHFIAMDGSRPIGFGQYYDCYDANSMEVWYQIENAGEVFSIDYMIGDPSYLGKGWGKALVGVLTEKVREAGGKIIVVQPDADNDKSNNVLLANGYRYVEEMKYYQKDLV